MPAMGAQRQAVA